MARKRIITAELAEYLRNWMQFKICILRFYKNLYHILKNVPLHKLIKLVRIQLNNDDEGDGG